jgi:hypothetical protein
VIDQRDHELGAALRALDVPDHLPGFETRLRARLEQPSPSRLGFLRRGRIRLALAGGLAALLLGVATLSIGLPGESDVATAAEVRTEVAEAFSSLGSLEGVFVNREGGGESRWRFVVDGNGNFRITSLSGAGDLAYDARTNVESYSDGPSFVERVGIAPGPPDADASPWVVDRGLGSVVSALAAASDTTVEETEYEGRPAWLLRTPTGNPGEERTITVDRETGVPVASVRTLGSRVLDQWSVEGLRVGESVPQSRFRVRRRSGQDPTTRYDMAFRRVELRDVAGVVGYAPLVPATIPRGFELAEVAVALESRPTGNEQRQNPESRNVVSLSFRRGLDRLTVTTREIGSDRSAWIDPVTAGILAGRPERVTFSGGALDGVTGELVVDPGATPHVWALTDRLVVTVAGDLSRDELLQVAESLS